jgi:hypothetical protein
MYANHEVPIDLTTFKNLVFKATDVLNVWNIRMPLLPWKNGNALRERVSLVSKLEATFSHRAIWLSEWTSDEYQGWKVLTSDERLSSLDDDLELEQGMWALFFFQDQPDIKKLQDIVPNEPSNATFANQAVRNIGACAAIWSWYDNGEWLVVLPSTERD